MFVSGLRRYDPTPMRPAQTPEQAETARRTREFEERVDKIVLVTMAMWSLLQEKTGVTEDDLIARVQEIDLKDGVEDGKVSKQLANCEACGRAMNSRHTKCLYCGNEKLIHSAFDRVT